MVDFHARHPPRHDPGSAHRAASPLALALAVLLGYHLVVAGRCRKFRHQALHDDLTGLPNRRCLDQVLRRAISAAKCSGEGASLVLIDLDHFKELNDSLGHSEGDAVLREAARRFKSSLRQGDFLARVGGDEFCLLLPRTRPEEATGLAARLRSTLSERPLPLGDASVHLDATVGLSYCPSDGDEAEALLRSADAALYASKRSRHTGRSDARTEAGEPND